MWSFNWRSRVIGPRVFFVLETLRQIRVMPRFAILASLAVVLLARLAVPAGWMPVVDATGTHLAICTGMGPLDERAPAMATPGMGQHHAPGHHEQGPEKQSCPFVGLASALIEPALPTFDVPQPFVAAILVVHQIGVPFKGSLASPPPPSTGPPSLH